MHRITASDTHRTYFVDEKLADFSEADGTVTEEGILEILAYYRGESVTEQLVMSSMEEHGYSDSSNTLVKTGNVAFLCKDGEWNSNVDIMTLVRTYELISDLYELDPTVRRIEMPFTIEEVTGAIWTYSSINSNKFPVLLYLRPKRTETYLWHTWSKELVTEDFCRMVGSGLEGETKMALSRYAVVLPDKDLYPIVDWMMRGSRYDLLEALLLEKVPSLFLWLMLQHEYNRIWWQHQHDRWLPMVISLIEKGSFKDKWPLVIPDGFKWVEVTLRDPIDPRRVISDGDCPFGVEPIGEISLSGSGVLLDIIGRSFDLGSLVHRLSNYK